jgi:hypothetical protein
MWVLVPSEIGVLVIILSKIVLYTNHKLKVVGIEELESLAFPTYIVA